MPMAFGSCSGTSPATVTAPETQSRPGRMRPSPDGSRVTHPDAAASDGAMTSPASSRRATTVLSSIRRRLRRSSIALRMVLLVVLLVGLTTVSIGALSYARARRALDAGARARRELLAVDMARKLHGELSDAGAESADDG